MQYYNNRNNRPTNCAKQMNLINTFRKLWQQHVMWTRSFIISTAANLGDLQLVTKRLLRNPEDFEIELQKFYGNEKSKKSAELLTAHLTIAAKLVNTLKNNDAKNAEVLRKKWYENAEEIATFLASINPNWNKQEWNNLLNEHLKMTESEARHRLSGQYAMDIAEYDDIENQALRMADYMAAGIQKQFRI